MCVPEDEIVIETPVVKEFEITSTGKRKAPSGLTDKELKACDRILLELFCLETSTCFHEPVSKQVPNYYKIITNPMDLSSIKCKLRRGHFNHYNTIEEFLSDIKLVFKNCYTYNNASSEIYSVGKSIEAYFETIVQTYLPCYLDFIHREAPSPAGSASSLEPNGDAPRPKKRRSPAPDASRNSPVHIS